MPGSFKAVELSLLAGSLQGVGEAQETSDWLWSNAGRFENQWRNGRAVSATGIPLPLPRRKGLVPRYGELEGVYLSFVFAEGEEAHVPARADFQVLVTGSLLGANGHFELEDHWRVDTHLDYNGGGIPHEIHPLFHFQRGGHALDGFAQHENFLPGPSDGISGVWRGVLQCEWPRMPTLPMDPILGIDFCIGQANGAVWNRLRNIPEYFALVERAQCRVWLPFFEELSNAEFRKRWLGNLVI